MEVFTFESKIYIAVPKKKTIVIMILNVILALFAVTTIIMTIMEGFRFDRFGELCIAFLVVSYFKSNVKPGYQFSIADMQVSTKSVDLVYHNIKYGNQCGDIEVTIQAENVQRIEYSKQLNAMRFVGKIQEHFTGVTQNELRNDWVVYFSNDSHGEVMKVQESIVRYLNKTIVYME